MKNLFFILLFLPFFISGSTCSCGSFSSGVYEYEVEEGSGCCSGIPSGYGETGEAHYISYERNEGAWQISSIRGLQPSSAQSECCEPNA